MNIAIHFEIGTGSERAIRFYEGGLSRRCWSGCRSMATRWRSFPSGTAGCLAFWRRESYVPSLDGT